MGPVFGKLLMLAMMCSVAACSPTLTTPTVGTDQATIEKAAAAAVSSVVTETCAKAWLPTTYSSRDTEETQLGNRANNAARDEWCRQ